MKPGIITTISAVLLLLASGTTALCHESYDKITYVSIHKTTKDPNRSIGHHSGILYVLRVLSAMIL